MLLNGSSLAKQFVVAMAFPLADIEKSSPEVEANVEETAYRIAKEHPPYQILGSGSPSRRDTSRPCRIRTSTTSPASFTQVSRDSNAATLKLQVISSAGPVQHGQTRGVKASKTSLPVCNKLFPETRFEGVGIHPYRKFPEMPRSGHGHADVPGNAQTARLWRRPALCISTRAAYYYPLNVPAWSVSPGASCQFLDAFGFMLTPSYDMGWGERVRSRYDAAQLACGVQAYETGSSAQRLGYRCFWTIELTYAWMAMSSALGDILGNSTFKKDIRFTPGARAYVFEDERKTSRGRRPGAGRRALDLGQENAAEMRNRPERSHP